MKILIECLWGPEAGSVFTFGMAFGLKQNGHDVYCILAEDMKDRNQWLETFGSSHLAFVRTTPKRKRPLTSSAVFFADCLMIRRKYRDILFDMAIRTFVLPFDSFLLNCTKYKKLVCVCHDPVPHSGMDPKRAKQYQDEIRRSDDVIVLTESFIPLVEKEYGKSRTQIHFMRHGLMNYGRHSGNMGRKNPSEEINYLFFGRIEKYKGLHVLADAYRKVSAKYQNVSLTVAGGGDFAEYRNEYAELPNVTVINRYIRNEEISELFDTGNTVVVLPYIDATQSGVIPIAFEFGNPVIASNAGGLTEQLFKGRFGLLFETGDSSKLASAMISFLETPGLYGSESEKMREGKKLLQWENLTKALIDQWD